MSDTHALEEAIADSELLYINFFNGRLLSAGDLTQEQTVNRARARHLGLALGAGVAFGLEVAPAAGSPPPEGWVEVTAGLAINAAGQTLRLAGKQTIALVETPDPAQRAECVFADCELIPAGTTASASGYYLLTIAPAAKKNGLAPVSGLGNQIADCNSKYYAEGVKFRFLRLQTGVSGVTARNLLAYRCYGRPGALPGDLLNAGIGVAAPAVYGVGALLASGQLTDEDVPLAIVEWRGSAGLGFIDLWSVRRRTERPSAEGSWEYFVADRRQAESEAMFLQFQDQIQDLPGGTSPLGTLTAESQFAFLPPAGVLPTGSDKFNWRTFLGPLAPEQETTIDLEIWRRVLRESLLLEPIPVPPFATLSNRVTAAPWPAPVKVYRVPERNEVLITRARLGRVRVFMPSSTVSGTSVKLTLGNTNVALIAPARSAGRSWYLIDDVPAGTHSLEIAVSGFLTLTVNAVATVEGRTTDVGPVLLVAPAAEAAAAPMLPPTSVTTSLPEGPITGPRDSLIVPIGLSLKITVDPNKAEQISNLPKGVEDADFLFQAKEVREWLKLWQEWLSATGKPLGANPEGLIVAEFAKLKTAIESTGAPQNFFTVEGFTVFGDLALPVKFAKA